MWMNEVPVGLLCLSDNDYLQNFLNCITNNDYLFFKELLHLILIKGKLDY